MSSGGDCGFTENPDNTWTYRLQLYPYGDTEEYETFGPFRSFAVAHKDLYDNHQNPGGYSIATQPEGKHRHEWTKDTTQVPVGFTVQVDVESLPLAATKAEVVALVQSLPVDHAAFQVRTHYGWREATFCQSCHAMQE